MKSKRRKRVIASVLCMVLMLSTGMSTLAEADAGTVPAVEETTAAQTTAQETKSTSTDAQTAETETQTQTETETQTETKQTEEAAQTQPEETTAAQPTEEASGGETTQTETDQTAQNTQDQTTSAETSGTETQNEAVETQPEETETTMQTEVTQETKEEASVSPAFSASIEAEDKSATVYVSAEEGVFPEGTTVTAKRIDGTAKEYDQVEKSLNSEIAKSNKDVLDFVAYDITFRDAEGNEIEPEGEVQVSLDFHDMELGGASKEDSTVSVIHVKDDFSTETVQSDVDLTGEQLKQVEFKAEKFSIYAVTVNGIVERYRNEIQVGDYANIEFWDKEIDGGTQKINFNEAYRLDQDDIGVSIQVIINGGERFDKKYKITSPNSNEFGNDQINMQTTVQPGEGYWLAQECRWQKANENEYSTFGGSGSTGPNQAGDKQKWNVLTIYLTTDKPNKSCTSEVEGENGTKDILVDLYNYNTDIYNEYFDLDSDSLLLRSAWGNYKADYYENIGGSWNISCGKTGICYGLASMTNENIKFAKKAAFFDTAFDTAKATRDIGTKYSDVNFKFLYNEDTNEYSYNSEENHVHFDKSTKTITQYSSSGPKTLSDGTDFQKSGFFPFTDENDNMTDYGFGMRMDVDFLLNEDGTLENGEAMQFSFSGDDDVWVFIDGKLALDLGGLHSRRGGTINFQTKNVTYDRVQNENGQFVEPTPVNGLRPDTIFLQDLKPGTHTLTMYYLERGGNDSNCEIKFNLLVVNREGTLDFQKQDEDGQELEGAVFGLYETDEITEETIPTSTATSDDNGNVSFNISDLETTKTYYLKEISAPFGYVTNNTVYSVKITEDKSDSTNIKVIGTITGMQNGKVINEKYVPTGGTTKVSVRKEWTDGLERKPISVSLWADGKKIEGEQYTVELNDNNNWNHIWTNLPGDTFYEVKENDISEGLEVTTDVSVNYTVAGKPYRITPCNQFEYVTDENTVVIIFRNSEYHIWTPVEILDKTNFYTVLNSIKGNAGPQIDENNTRFYTGNNVEAGFQNDSDIQFSYDEEKIKVEYVASNAWSWFCIGNYNMDANIVLTNGIDEDVMIDIPVTKIWKGDTSQYSFDSVTVQLYQNGEAYGRAVQITKSAGWKYTYTDLPYWYKDQGGYKAYEYTVEETFVGTFPIENCEDWLFTEISGSAEDGFTITNNVPKLWGIGKVSSTNHKLPLEGAKFTLTSQDTSKVRYYGLSGNDGLIRWWTSYSDLGNIEKVLKFVPDGTYILEETKAPVGYQKNNVTWTIEIDDLQVTSIIDSKGIEIEPITPENRATSSKDIYLYENIPLYELPSAGGPGIFLYTIGGVLLLMAGSLILYKMKRGEVLKK